ncbi:MAG TPA: tRNA pseudouridine(54/55) synthase Pus10 [Thermoplasmata archaeon]|jgi:tRNA pseudouridine synthase 10|nr:tRNA pseudouridine(54/55) synthase Pus10 [Thermoplasmata archaeon]
MSRRLEIAGRALERTLCNHCLGRLFGKVSRGLSNDQRGVILRCSLPGPQPEPERSECYLCEGLFSEVEKFARLAEKSSEGYEFSTFLLGCKVDPEVSEREEQLWTEVGAAESESIKSELNREIGKRTEASMGKKVDFANPDIVFLVDTRFDTVSESVTPLFVYGRYRKFSREIPQTHWPCRDCRGKGCPRCDGKGRMYELSVQGLTGPVLMRHAQGTEEFFHGMGREDIDALMLGNGRPFVMEVRSPRIRSIDLPSIEREINESAGGKVEVEGLRPSSRAEMRAIKEAKTPKTYRVSVRFEADFDHRKLNDIVRALAEKPIRQLTPNRVAHRRANLERVRGVRRFEIESVDGREAVFVVEADSGTYIKELMHGDGGRTQPNVAETVGVPCEVMELDVIAIGDSGA